MKIISTLPLLVSKHPQINFRGNTDPSTPNILILLFDTLSARHISLYGYPRNTMPNLARFAERATVFHNHHSAGNFTTPSTGSLLTGTYPWTHRALSHQATIVDAFATRNLFSEFKDGLYTRVGFSHNYLVNVILHHLRGNLDSYTLPSEIARSNYNFSDEVFFSDYVVASRSERSYFKKPGGFSNSLFLQPLLWFLKTADERKIANELEGEFPRGVPGYHDMLYPLNETIDWIEDQLTSLPQPFLAYMHMMPPHDPYTPGHEFVNIFWDGYKPVSKPPHVFSAGFPDWALNEQRVYYDEYIAYVDSEFGRLVDFMEREGILDNTWVIFTSDHGELFEREIWKHTTRVLYEPVVQVPLLISRPGQEIREDVHSPTSTVDLLPTLMHVTGRAVPDWCEGEVLPPFGTQSPNSERSIFVVEGKSNPKISPIVKATLAMIKGRYKVIKYIGYEKLQGRFEVYDLLDDPEELNDLVKSSHPIVPNLTEELDQKIAQVNEPYMK
jgi:arylsulfatase A-like enzyme